MKLITTSLLVAVGAFMAVALYSTPAEAYIGLCCGKCGGNMPMNLVGGGVPETCEFRLKIQPQLVKMDGLADGTTSLDPSSLLGMPAPGVYMAAPTEMDMWMLNLAIGYSFTDDFFAGLMFMYTNHAMPMIFNAPMQAMTGQTGYTMRSNGMGDTMLMTKYRLYTDDPLIPTSQVSFLAGLSLPTGSIDEKNRTHPLPIRQLEQLPYGMQLGSGTFDPSIGLLYQGSSSPFWWGANAIHTGRWYDNARGYRLGNETRLDLYGMFQFRHDMVAQLQLSGAARGMIEGRMDEYEQCLSGCVGSTRGGGAANPLPMTPLWETENYGGRRVSLSLGLQWQPVPMHIVEITAGIPVHEDLNGPQLEEAYRIFLTYYIEIPTSRSIRFSGNLDGGSELGF